MVSMPSVYFEDITVVTPTISGTVNVLTNQDVWINNGRISSIVNHKEIDRKNIVGDVPTLLYKGKDKILLPSFANAHSHLGMTLMRNLADDLPLHTWLFDYIFPIEDKMNAKQVVAGSLISAGESIKSGVTAIADMYFFQQEVATAFINTNMRLNIAVGTFLENEHGELYLSDDRVCDFVNQFQNQNNGRIKASVSIHSVYLFEEHFYKGMAKLAKDNDIGIQIHISETKKEVEDCLKKYHMTPTQKLNEDHIFDSPTIAAHCIYLSKEDRNILKEKGVYCVHNPISNLKLGSGIADIVTMDNEGLIICLGTDGAASNNRLDFYSEMRTGSLLQKGIHLDPTILPAEKWIKFATENGFKALGYENVGRIEVGAEADIQVLDCSKIEAIPVVNPVQFLVNHAGREMVETVMCRGEFLLYKKELTTIDEEKTIYEMKQERRELFIS